MKATSSTNGGAKKKSTKTKVKVTGSSPTLQQAQAARQITKAGYKTPKTTAAQRAEMATLFIPGGAVVRGISTAARIARVAKAAQAAKVAKTTSTATRVTKIKPVKPVKVNATRVKSSSINKAVKVKVTPTQAKNLTNARKADRAVTPSAKTKRVINPKTGLKRNIKLKKKGQEEYSSEYWGEKYDWYTPEKLPGKTHLRPGWRFADNGIDTIRVSTKNSRGRMNQASEKRQVRTAAKAQKVKKETYKASVKRDKVKRYQQNSNWRKELEAKRAREVEIARKNGWDTSTW